MGQNVPKISFFALFEENHTFTQVTELLKKKQFLPINMSKLFV